MKTLLLSFILLLINILCITIIGILKLQELLSIIIYFSPIILDIIIIITLYKRNFKKIRIVLLQLFLLIISITTILSYIIYLGPSFISSIIFLCTFVAIFDIIPLIITFIVFCFKKTE